MKVFLIKIYIETVYCIHSNLYIQIYTLKSMYLNFFSKQFQFIHLIIEISFNSFQLKIDFNINSVDILLSSFFLSTSI